MKKKLTFAAVLACAMSVVSLASCGGPKYDYKFQIWAAEAAKPLTLQQAKAWAEQMKTDYNVSIGVEVNAVGEGDAASKMITDVEGGADVFCFAQDQLARLKSANALTTITDATLKKSIIDNNDEISINAASLSNDIVAYPLTSDNGYLMYYDKSVFPDATKLENLEDVIDVCEQAGKLIYFKTTDAWYNAAFFFGFGCKSEWTTNELGHFTSYDDTYNSANGVKAMKAIYNLGKTHKDVLVNDADASHAFSKDVSGKIGGGVCISGTWDYNNVKTALGENMGAVELPSVTVDGTKAHLGSFIGCKLLGVKPQTDATKGAYAQLLAQYLSSQERQLERYQALGWGPSNVNAQKNEDVKNNPALKAIANQLPYSTLQGQYPGDWWTTAGNLGDTVTATKGTDAEIKNLLKGYEASISSYLDGLND